MGKCYDIVKASSHEEAIRKAPRKVGDLCRVSNVTTSANGDKTYTVQYEYEPVKLEEDLLVTNQK